MDWTSHFVQVEAAGIEPETPISQSLTEQELAASCGEVSALCLHVSGNTCQCVASLDPILIRLIELWPALAADAQKTIHAICLDAVLLGDE